MFRVVTEEEAILATQQLEFIYSKLGMLFQVLPNSPRICIDPPKPAPRPHVDGVIRSVSDFVSQRFS